MKKRESNAKTASLWQVGGFVAGAAVVTAIDAKSRLRGMMANSFTSVSMGLPPAPARIGQLAMRHDEFYATDIFAISRPPLSETI